MPSVKNAGESFDQIMKCPTFCKEENVEYKPQPKAYEESLICISSILNSQTLKPPDIHFLVILNFKKKTATKTQNKTKKKKRPEIIISYDIQ